MSLLLLLLFFIWFNISTQLSRRGARRHCAIRLQRAATISFIYCLYFLLLLNQRHATIATQPRRKFFFFFFFFTLLI